MKSKESPVGKDPFILPASFSTETLMARKNWHNIFKIINGTDVHLTICYPARLSVRFEGVMSSFSHKQELKEFTTKKTQPCKKYQRKNI